ncbi:MAG: 2-C-methyl-D-erythritol 2,4-cyclodiphosphate synthase [Deltaproteobacteria bacterium]|nr:2-C-methyl-D-erythritol 2,4-cyclodiphosphate synthase [Deltaproteobacteria bacterium]
MKIGFGYDAHRLVKDRKLLLGAVEIPFEKGLLGHSDADALVHAVIDAIIGAAGLKDIGRHFPPTDKAYKDISSLVLLKRTAGLMRKSGFRVGNIDATIVCERPKLGGYIPVMEENISKALGCEKTSINIKAKTEEGMGYTGKGLGIKTYAVALLEETRKR